MNYQHCRTCTSQLVSLHVQDNSSIVIFISTGTFSVQHNCYALDESEDDYCPISINL